MSTEYMTPPEAELVIQKLESAGYEAYLVGGAVRDKLRGEPIKDSDICTNAYPEEMLEVFSDMRCIPTGLKHGTLTVLTDFAPVEITTYRTDGKYTDHRRPDTVSFTRSLTEDLARRDLTVNAMAWNPRQGLIDPYGGEADLKANIMRAVGDPKQRFTEDALRILRALRFASRFDATIEEETKKALFSCMGDLKYIAQERICAELVKLIVGKGAEKILLEYKEIIFAVIPELRATDGCSQNNPYHCMDVYEHMVRSVEYAPKIDTLRMALLLHDIGKPTTKTTDAGGTEHFYGHEAKSADIAEQILLRLRFDNKSIAAIKGWIYYHDTVKKVKFPKLCRIVGELGMEQAEQLLEICRADIMAQSVYEQKERLMVIERVKEMLQKIREENCAVKISDLNINGHELLSMGFRGIKIGEIQRRLLSEVMEGCLKNEKEALLQRAMELK